MLPADYSRLALSSLRFSHLRTLLTALGIAVGIAAVVLLTALGGGVQQYILHQFTQFGSHIIGVNPGKKSTLGLSGAVISNIRPLTVADARDLNRLRGVRTAVPVVQGYLPVEHGNRSRWTNILGVNHQTPQTWSLRVASGAFLPDAGRGRPRPLAVLGHKLAAELFPGVSPLGRRIRIGQERYRVIGVMASKGQILGFDMDDMVYIPIDKAMALFNRDSLMEIDLLYTPGLDEKAVIERVRQRLIQRHGDEDFTITSQADMLSTLGSIMGILKAVVAGLGGISLLVGGIGIFTIMSIAVNERISEIGLLRALGASKQQILRLFLLEAAMLAALGGLAGLLLGLGVALATHWLLPAMPLEIAWDYVLLAEIIAVVTGLVSGLLPARRAAGMQPVDALRHE